MCTSVKRLPCYIIINYVKDNALNCIKNIEENGDIKLNITNDLHYKKHAQRIKQQHQGYIDKFVNYIKSKYPDEYVNGGQVKKLVDECIRIRDEYNKYCI